MPALNSSTLGRFCRELAGGLDTLDALLAEWQLTPPQFEALQRSPGFVTEMQLVQREMQDLGNDAGYIYRMKSLSESLLPEFITLLKDAASGNALKFEMIKWAAEMARLKEKPAAKTFDAGPRGPTVVFQFGAGLPIKTLTINPEDNTGNHVDAPALTVIPEDVPAIDGWPS